MWHGEETVLIHALKLQGECTVSGDIYGGTIHYTGEDGETEAWGTNSAEVKAHLSFSITYTHKRRQK